MVDFNFKGQDMARFIQNCSEVYQFGIYRDSVTIDPTDGMTVRTSPMVFKVADSYYKNISLDLANGNLLNECVRDGYARAVSNAIYVYNYVLRLPITLNDLKYFYEKWVSSGSELCYFDFVDTQYLRSRNMSIISSYVIGLTHSKSYLFNETIHSHYCSYTSSWYKATIVAKRLYSLMRMVSRDYLFIYLKNSPASLVKITQALGIDKMEDQELVTKGVKEFIYNVPLADAIETDGGTEKLNELLLDLGAIANRFKEG